MGRARSRSVGSQFQIIAALNAEWAELAATCADRVCRWELTQPALVGCTGLGEVLAAIRASPDPVLRALIEENHRLGDQLAGRVVLQTMLGKVVSLARRDGSASVDDYVTEMWCQIRTYPLRARPNKIAANLALDTLKAVSREDPARRSRARIELVDGRTALDGPLASRARRELLDHNAELAAVTAWRVIAAAAQLGLIDATTRAVLESVYADGLSGREAARRHQMSSDMVRFRCSKAVRRLRSHARELADAA